MQSSHKKSFAAEQLARQKKKNPLPWIVAGIAVVVVIGVGYILVSRYKVKETVVPEQEQIHSIAVLPFDNLSDDPEQEYFCDGLADAILSKLTNIGTLRVIARNSSFVFKGQHKDIRAIGDSLNVDSILEGSVLKSGNRIRITAQLIRVADNSHLLSDQYDYELANIFALQDSISFAVVNALQVKLQSNERAAIKKRYTDNTEAYQQYLMGRHFLNRRTEEDMKTGLVYFQKAIAIDPNFALAYTGIADSYNLLGLFGNLPPLEVFPEAKKAAQQALEIDDTLAEAYTSLGYANLIFDWDWDASERRFKKAIALNPGYVWAQDWFADFYRFTGRNEDALREYRKARKMDPLYLITYVDIANTYWNLGRYDEAMQECQKALDIDRNFAPAYFIMGLAHLSMNRHKEAIQCQQKALELSGGYVSAKSALGYTYAKTGDRDKAEQIVTSLIEQKQMEYVPSFRIAYIYLGLGDNTTALEWLEKAYEEREIGMLLLFGSEWKTLRSEPRFQELLKKLYFPGN